jgi:integrase
MPPIRKTGTGLQVVSRPGRTTLYLRGTIRGKSVYESTGTADPVLADEARAAREAEIYRAAVHGAGPERIAFHVAVASYLGVEPRSASTKVFLGRLVRFLGPKAVCQDLTQAKLDAACRVLCRPHATPATRLRNVITPARAVLMHASRRGWCQTPVFEPMKGSPARTDWLTPAEAEAMIAACTGRLGHMRAILAMLFCSGGRVGELIALELPDLDLQHARAVLRDTKNGRDRLVALPPRLVAELANMLGARHKPSRRSARLDGPERPAVFLDRARRPYRLTDDSRTSAYGGQLRASWKAVLKAAGVAKAVTPHHARHTWASWHYAVHKDLLLLKRDGDWSSVDQVERYAHLTPAGMAPAICRFWGIAVPGEARRDERGVA